MTNCFFTSLTAGLTLCLALSTHISFAQCSRAEIRNEFYVRLQQNVQPGNWYSVNLPQPASSIVLQTPLSCPIDGMMIQTPDGRRFSLVADNEHAGEDTVQTSALLRFPEPVSSILVYSHKANGSVRMHLISAPPASPELRTRIARMKRAAACEKPATIDQDVWRAGLPAPKNFPEATQVQHVIVHHSAGSNSDTDYVNVVRNIYLYHTQSNGWDDVGYNFLVAQDGTIFQGRDGRGTFEDDNVKGAHLCGKNSNTMGICMLGTYTSVAPTDTALGSLAQLIAWKINKEGLSPQDSSRHPVGDQDAEFLKTIAGHRDGCATECPGDLLYARLPQLRWDVQALTVHCTTGVPERDKLVQGLEYRLYPQPARQTAVLELRHPELLPHAICIMTDLQGRTLRTTTLSPDGHTTLQLDGLPSGIYLLRLQSEAGAVVIRMVVSE